MICTILKQEESIKTITPAKDINIISKQWIFIHENTEKLLMVWLMEKQLAGDTMMEAIIYEKVQAIYTHLLQQTPDTSTSELIKASHGRFEKRTSIRSIVRHGEAASENMKTAEGYIPQ